MFAIIKQIMKRSPKIILAIIIAVLFVGGAVLSVFKQSQKTRIAQGTISATDGGWVAPVEGEKVNASSTSLIDTNLTTILSKQVFSNFIVLNESGNLNAQTINDLTDQLASQIIQKVPTAKVYTAADLHIIPNPTKEDIRKYGNDFFVLRNKYQNTYIRDMTSPGSPILDETDTGAIKTFALIGALYEELVPELLKISVPIGLVELHLKILNNYNESAFGLKQFDGLNNDPVAAISGLNVFSKNSNLETTILGQISAYFIKNGIIFYENEPGYGWNNV